MILAITHLAQPTQRVSYMIAHTAYAVSLMSCSKPVSVCFRQELADMPKYLRLSWLQLHGPSLEGFTFEKKGCQKKDTRFEYLCVSFHCIPSLLREGMPSM